LARGNVPSGSPDASTLSIRRERVCDHLTVLDMPKVVSEEDRASRREEMEGRRKQQAKDKAKAQREEDKARKPKEVEGIPKISSFFKRKK
jgi:hypothetical protein